MDKNYYDTLANVPPATVAVFTLAGFSLQDWVLIATLAWLGMQALWFCYSRCRILYKRYFGKRVL